jgi:hypothetical protein
MDLIFTRLALCFAGANLLALESFDIIFANLCKLFSCKANNADPESDMYLTIHDPDQPSLYVLGQCIGCDDDKHNEVDDGDDGDRSTDDSYDSESDDADGSTV